MFDTVSDLLGEYVLFIFVEDKRIQIHIKIFFKVIHRIAKNQTFC